MAFDANDYISGGGDTTASRAHLPARPHARTHERTHEHSPLPPQKNASNAQAVQWCCRQEWAMAAQQAHLFKLEGAAQAAMQQLIGFKTLVRDCTVMPV